MAQQATLRKSVTDGAILAEKRPVGRPKGSVSTPHGPDYAGKQTFRRNEDFSAWLAKYANTTGLLGYVYRLKPKIDFSLCGRSESSIWKTSNPAEMTEEFIGQRFGRGYYNLKLTDANAPGGSREVAKTWFTISDPDLPPIYDPRALLLADPENQDEVARLLQNGTLIRDSQNGLPRLRNEQDGHHAAPAPAAYAGSPVAPNVAPVAGLDLSSILVTLINRGSSSPHEAARDLLDAARMIAPAAPAIDADTIVNRVVERLGGAGGGVGPQSDFAAYERVERFITKVKGTAEAVGTLAAVPAASDGGALNPAGWMPHIAPALSQARALLGDIFGYMRSKPSGSNGAAPGELSAAAAPAMEQMTMDQLIAEVAELGLQKMEEGVQGFDFAAYVCLFHRAPQGLEVFRRLDQLGGTVGVMALMGMNPITRPMLADVKKRAQITSFLDSFFSFAPDGDGSEVPEGSDVEPPATAV